MPIFFTYALFSIAVAFLICAAVNFFTACCIVVFLLFVAFAHELRESIDCALRSTGAFDQCALTINRDNVVKRMSFTY